MSMSANDPGWVHPPEPEPNPGGILARMRRAGQRASSQRRLLSSNHEYAFLVGALIDRATLERAEAEAAQCGTTTHEVLLASGWIAQVDYASALARQLGIPLVVWDAEVDAMDTSLLQSPAATGFPARLAQRPCRLLSATAGTPNIVRRQAADLLRRGDSVMLTPQFRIDAAIEAQLREERVDRAVCTLLHEQPWNSAGAGAAIWQLTGGIISVAVIIGGAAVFPGATFATLTAFVALPFLCVTMLRLFALREALSGAGHRMRQRRRPAARLPDSILPIYSVLVPLLREANVLAGLVQSLRSLDYPPAKLEIILVLEAADTVTQAAVLSLELPGNFRTLVVPDVGLCTKPKALNYALQFARGDFVVVYDAEDRPQPDQLRRAVQMFRHAPPKLGCVQAQLNIYNPWQSWLTRQFTIEYSALFDAILPALERLRLPVPLGGTSNHFRRETLLATGAWDPFNVTEDADLGIRLARKGYHTAILASTTWEEAPATLAVWFKQRTRWLKGWLQTYLVHTRNPARLNAELGLRGAIGFHTLMGGLILSALVHPLFYVLLAYYALSGDLFAAAATPTGYVLWWTACTNLALGYTASILVGLVSVWRRGRPGLSMAALVMPFYWLLISLAAMRAVYHLARIPHFWEKTDHGIGRG